MFSKLYHHDNRTCIFNMFIAKMRGFSLDSSINTGEAAYMKTKRGMTMRAGFVSLYSKYAESHIKPAIEMAWVTVVIMSSLRSVLYTNSSEYMARLVCSLGI